jgi:hypothetical protein
MATLYFRSPFFLYQKVRVFFKFNSSNYLLATWICSDKEAPEKCKVSSILPADVPCLPGSRISTTQSRYDDAGGGEVSRWPFPPCHLWIGSIYCRLSRAGVACCYRPGVVSEVSCSTHLWISNLLVCVDVMQSPIISMPGVPVYGVE